MLRFFRQLISGIIKIIIGMVLIGIGISNLEPKDKLLYSLPILCVYFYISGKNENTYIKHSNTTVRPYISIDNPAIHICGLKKISHNTWEIKIKLLATGGTRGTRSTSSFKVNPAISGGSGKLLDEDFYYTVDWDK
jgi:hypothetical protein